MVEWLNLRYCVSCFDPVSWTDSQVLLSILGSFLAQRLPSLKWIPANARFVNMTWAWEWTYVVDIDIRRRMWWTLVLQLGYPCRINIDSNGSPTHLQADSGMIHQISAGMPRIPQWCHLRVSVGRRSPSRKEKEKDELKTQIYIFLKTGIYERNNTTGPANHVVLYICIYILMAYSVVNYRRVSYIIMYILLALTRNHRRTQQRFGFEFGRYTW